MSLTVNADLDISDLIGLHGRTPCKDALFDLFPLSSPVSRESVLSFGRVATGATVHHSIQLTFLETFAVSRRTVSRGSVQWQS